MNINEATKANNPWCEHCQEDHCCIGADDKCEMIRVYEKLKEEVKS